MTAYGEPCASRGARTVWEGASARRLPHDICNTSETRSNQNSYGLNYQKLGKELMSTDELAVMDGGKCILQVQGVRPFFSNKYDITKHPQYKKLSDYDEKNKFYVQKYLKHQLKVKSDDVFEVYETNIV